jgi:hypothetical protein
MVAGAESMSARPDGVFLVGSGVDIPMLKRALEAATSLAVTAPEEPEMALARGAALASANAQLGAPSTVAMPYVQDPPRGLAYSAESDNETDLAAGDYREHAADRDERRSRKVLVILGATTIFVVGAVALTLALAFGIRPHVDQRPDISTNVVAPATQAAPPPQAPAPAPPPPSAPAPPAPNPGPSANPPQQWLQLPPRDDDHNDHWGWLRRHLGRGILFP